MNSSKITSAVIIALLLVTLFLGLRLWASTRAVMITGPSAIKQAENGSIYIMSNDVLYIHDKSGGLVDRIPMSTFGIDRVIGDFWVYRNGDLLLRRSVVQTLTLSGEAENYARTGAGEKDRLGNGESILQHCSIATFQCEQFGEGGDVFDRLTTFGVTVDEERGMTYLSDTVGHQLLMLDGMGNVVKRSKDPFQFPNKLVLDRDGLLYAADTNNHRLAGVSTDKEKFGTVEKEIKIVHPRDPLMPSWPIALARTSDDRWWVINADAAMSNGIVMILDEKGVFGKTVSLPKGADPISLAALEDSVLISDPTLMRVYRASGTGTLLEDFGSLSFKMDLSELRRQRRLYETVAASSMWALLVLFVVALMLARTARREQAEESAKQAAALPGAAPRQDSGAQRYDYHNLLGLHRIKISVLAVLLAAGMFFFFMISRGLTLFHKQFFPSLLLAHFLISYFSYLHFKRSYVEMNEQGITWQGMFRSIQSPWSGIRKISVYGSSSRIVTDHGNFTIGSMEPADSPPGGWLDHLRADHIKFHKELVGEIQSRAPQAIVSVSWFVRYRWNQVPSAKTAEEAQLNEPAGVLGKSETEQLDKAWMVVKVIWVFMLGSLAIYLLVCTLMESQLRPLASDLPPATLRGTLFGIAMATVVAAGYIRRFMLKISDNHALIITRRHEQHPAASKYTSAIVVVMALSESIGIYGVVLFLLSSDALLLYAFLLISAIAMYYYRPRNEELMQLALEMRKNQGMGRQVQ